MRRRVGVLARDGLEEGRDPRTGGVLAMAGVPGYDANRFPDVRDLLHRNRTVTDTYEPGSTFKIVTVTAALGEGLVTPERSFVLPYEIQVADRVIHDAEEQDPTALSHRSPSNGHRSGRTGSQSTSRPNAGRIRL